jgi:hypothetical protein
MRNLIKILILIVFLFLGLLFDKYFIAPKRVVGHNWKYNSGYCCEDFIFKTQYYISNDTIIMNSGRKAIIYYQIFDRLIITDISGEKFGEYVKK